MDLGIEGLEDATPLGSGGFGTVYRARQVRLNRTVAVKVLPRTGGDATAELRFQREAAALGTLATHPNIVTVYDSGLTADGQPYLIMELMSRGSLADQIASEGPVPWARVLEVGVGLAGALASAHDAGILHRDIKPANVLLSDFDEPVLADFGIARMEGAGQTQSAAITGSAAHLAPELLHGEPPTEASDVYALGSTLFHLLAGTPAFVRSTDQTIAAAYQRILTAPVPDLRANGIPGEVCDAIEKLLVKDPTERPATAVEAGELLRDLQRQAGLDATPLLVRKADAAAAAAVAATPDAPTGMTPVLDGPTTDATVTRPGPRKAHDTGTDAEGRPVPRPPSGPGVDDAPTIAGLPRNLVLGAGAGVVALIVAIAAFAGGGGGGGAGEDLTAGDATGTDGGSTGGSTTGTTGGATGATTDLTNASTYFGQCEAFASPDGAGDGSADDPYGTVEELLTHLPVGGVGCLLGGTYDADVTIDASMTGVEGTPSSVGAVKGQEVTVTGDWVVAEDGAHLRLADLDFVGDDGTAPLDVRANDVQVWYSSFTNPAGPCLDVQGDGTSTSPTSLAGVMLLGCGTADGAALRLGPLATFTATSVVFDAAGSEGGPAIDVGGTATASMTLVTFIGHGLVAAIREAPEAAEYRIFSLTQSIMADVTTPPVVAFAGPDTVGRFQFGPNCVDPADGVAETDVALFAESLPTLTNLEEHTTGQVAFIDRAARQYALDRASGCQGFGAQPTVLDLRDGGW